MPSRWQSPVTALQAIVGLLVGAFTLGLPVFNSILAQHDRIALLEYNQKAIVERLDRWESDRQANVLVLNALSGDMRDLKSDVGWMKAWVKGSKP